MTSRKESITSAATRTQSVSGPPSTDMVKVAVLPPRLPPGMAPPTGIGAAEAFSWDESLNWQHNESLEAEKGKKGVMEKIGLTARRKKANDTPPFTFRNVTYDTWRKHYAKDKDGNYRGTHAPAEDCLLKPEDVAKWRADPITTRGDQYTRGSHALPVYDEVNTSQELPQYEPQNSGALLDERAVSVSSSGAEAPKPQQEVPRQTLIDGKTSAQLIQEAKDKHEAKKREGSKGSWKGYLKKGFEMAAMGS